MGCFKAATARWGAKRRQNEFLESPEALSELAFHRDCYGLSSIKGRRCIVEDRQWCQTVLLGSLKGCPYEWVTDEARKFCGMLVISLGDGSLLGLG